MTEENRAKDQAGAQLESIKEMIETLKKARKEDEKNAVKYKRNGEGGIYNPQGNENEEKAQESILSDPLEIGIIEQYFILLCWGGPAVRIIGTLDEYFQPETARLQYQDWGTPWIDYNTDKIGDDEIVLEYARQFYYEGLGRSSKE